VYTLSEIGYTHPYIVWVISIPAWIFTLYVAIKRGRTARVSTPFNRIIFFLWISLGVLIFTFIAFGNRLNHQLSPLILTISAMPTFVSGIILKFKPLIVGGSLFWVLGIVSFIVSAELRPLIGALAVMCGYLLPGYLLKYLKV